MSVMGLKARTKATTSSEPHARYIAQLPLDRRTDIFALHELIRDVAPQLEPTIASGMLGYGPFEYQYASGRKGRTVKIGVANNKHYISMYCTAADANGYVAEKFQSRLPKADIGKACVRFKRLGDLDESVLRELIHRTAITGWG